jgi:Galactose oxidase, central domain
MLAVVTVVLASCDRGSDSSVGTSTGPVTTPPSTTASPSGAPTPATWRRIAAVPIEGDYYPPAATVWDGDEMLVVITQSDPKTYCSETLVAYAPATDSWRAIGLVPTPKGCFEGSDKAVWTGEELLLWGISNVAYDPAADTWRHLPRPPAGAGGPSIVVWTGTQMIGWGGGCCDQQLAEGAAYTPATNSWRMLPPSPLAGRHATGVWTGSEMIIAGGSGYEGTGPRDQSFTMFDDAAAYDPATRRWRKLPPMPVARGGGYYSLDYAAVWDGTEMLVVGGASELSASPEPLARGVAYNPSTNRWRWLAPMAYPRVGFVAVWAGDQLVVWGGIGVGSSIPAHGETYDPVENTWSALPKAPLRARVDAAAVWTETEVVIFGGTDARTLDTRRKPLLDGAALTPGSVSQ